MAEPKEEIILLPSGDVEEFIEKLLEAMKTKEIVFTPTGFGSWSPSKIKALACPLKYLLKNILKATCQTLVSPDDPKYADQFLSAIGTSAHTTLELMVQGKKYEEAHAVAKQKHLKDVTEAQWHRVEALEGNIRNFLIRIERFGADNPIHEMHTELKFAFDQNWKPCSFFSKNAYFRGVIDLPIILKNRDALVFDHKHGGSAKYGIKHHTQQLQSYAIAVVTHYKDIKGVMPMIHFIQEGEVAKGEYASKEKILNEYTRNIDSSIHGSIDYLKEMGAFKHVRGSYCDYCEFRAICHGGARGTANALQPVVDKSKVFFKC